MVAEEVGRIYQMDVNKIRMSLIDKWLPSSSSKQAEADTVITRIQ